MSKTNTDKRNKLAFLALGTTIVISLYWAFIIRIQQEWLVDKRAALEGLKHKIHVGKINAAKLPQYKHDLDLAQKRIEIFDNDMASGDVYRWLIRTFLTQQTNDFVEIVDLSPPRVNEMTVLPKVPYLEATFTLTGKGYYHDVGKFIADLENRFVHMRLHKLDLEPVHIGEANTPEAERVFFSMEVSTLVNTNELKSAEAPGSETPAPVEDSKPVDKGIK